MLATQKEIRTLCSLLQLFRPLATAQYHNTYTMETYRGHVRTPADAIKLFEACRLGLLPRVQRRLSEKERQSISSGSVFVWDEREAGMRRWTDGKSWSASRVSGSFLTYREMEGKRGGGQFAPPPVRRAQGKTPESGRGSDEDQDMDGPDGYRYKPDGLMKQSFSITTSNNQHLHLISYYSRPHPNAPDLPQPTSDPQLRHIIPVKGMYPETTVHDSPGPAASRTPMNQSQYMPPQQQMQQGPRGGPPPYPYQPHPGYAWPPSPVATPPYPSHYPGAVYAQSPYQNGSAHASPYLNQQHRSPHQQQQQQFAPQAPMGHQSNFDRPPPPLSDPSIPPHPTTQRPMSTATAAQLVAAQYGASRSPRLIQAQLIVEQQQQNAAQMAQRALQSAPPLDPRLQQTPVQLAPVNLPASQVNGAPPPRTTTPPQNTLNSRPGTPQSNRASPQGTPKLNGSTSQAQSIPSISSLVHAEDSVSVMNDNKSNSRGGSSSPKGDHNKVTDIPHEKLHHGSEDQRAVRVLDSKFRF